MNKLHIIFYLINIISTQIYAAPAGTAATLYDVLTTNFSKTCPILSNNVLVNNTYLSSCKDVSITDSSEEINMLNMKKFYCIGILTADLQLCNIISKNTYLSLPKTIDELQTNIHKIKDINPTNLCTLLQGVELFNDIKTIPSFIQKSVLTLKKELSGSHCPKLCADIIDDKSNDLCSMLYFIHVQINNVSKAIAHQRSSTKVPKEIKPTVAPVTGAKINSLNNKEISKQDLAINQQPSVEGTIEPKNEQPSQVSNEKIPDQSISQPPTVKPEAESNPKPASVVKPNANQEPPSQVPVPAANLGQESILSEPEDKVNKILTTVLPPVVEKTDSPPQQIDISSKVEIQPPLESGEDQSAKIKTSGVVTNKTPNNPKISPDKNEEPLDEIKYTTVESNNMKNYSDNDVFMDDNDDDDDEKDIFGTNPKIQKSQENFVMSGRNDISPNMKDAIDVEESNFFSYFMFISVMFIAGYVIYHNKQKILALLLEGRRDRNSRRRPSTSSYRKLNSNLEEAVTSKCSGSASHVIY